MAETVAALLGIGADVHSKSNDGSTPLHFAAANESDEVAALLISSGANVNATTEDGSTLLHIAAGYAEDRDGDEDDEEYQENGFGPFEEVTALLLANGADVHIKNKVKEHGG